MKEHITRTTEQHHEMTRSEIGEVLEGSLFEAYRELYRDMIINGENHQAQLDSIVDMLEGKYHNREHEFTLMRIEKEVFDEKDSLDSQES